MAEAKYRPARTWPKKKCFEEAARKVLNEKWTQGEAAAYYGVSRPRLNVHLKEERQRLAQLADATDEDFELPTDGDLAERIEAAALSPTALQERRRVGTFDEFDKRYFGRWRCPDCGVHHPTPQFHREISAACQGPDTRVVINMPPYHSKSTNVTVKDTVYDIVRDPNLRTLIISKNRDFARTFLRSINELLTNPELYSGGPSLIEEWGPFKPTDQATWNSDQIYVAGRVTAEKDPTVQVLGVGGQVYGRRADKIKADDCADVENQRNPARVGQMLEWFDKEVSSRIGRSGKLIWVGTRVHPGDIYATLGARPNYRVLRYPAIIEEGDAGAKMLWGDHFTYEMACAKRDEMRPADFQLVYQNVDVPGLGASFTQEMLDACKDKGRLLGHYESSWRLIAGLDLAGGSKDSGYTAGVLQGIDLRTGARYLVDIFNVKSMRSPVLKDKILEWSTQYPIYAWRVENNGIQGQLIQYDMEIVRALAQKGIRIEPHSTQGNKWDPQFGVESLAPLYTAQLMSIPWGNSPSARAFQPLIDQLVVFPMGLVSDVVMAHWFADLGCRDLLRRAHLPMFSDRMKVPPRIARNRRVVDFSNQEVRRVPLHEQAAAYSGPAATSYRRRIVGGPQPHDWEPPVPPEPRPYVNVPGSPDTNPEVDAFFEESGEAS